MAPITDEERAAVVQEVEEAMERITIEKDNVKVLLKISTRGREIAWIPMLCKKCAKPLYVHTEPECTKRTKISKQLQTVYNTIITQHETIKQEAKWAMLEAGIEIVDRKFEKEIDIPKWQKGWTWEQYKREIVYYKEATTRKPINQIMDMVRALKESEQTEIADRLITEMEEYKNDDDVIEK